MILLNYYLIQNIDGATTNFGRLLGETCVLRYNNGVLAQDYFCWLNNAIFADYSTITFLLRNMSDINLSDLRPIYCILRSTLEKYADILNLYIKREPYYAYIRYLNSDSASRAFKATGDTANEKVKKKEAIFFANSVKQSFNTNICNRTTRYYLLGEFNKLPQLTNLPFILEFNKSISNLDSRFSQILHNNIELNNRNNFENSNEILKSIHYIMYMSLCLFQSYYQYNSALLNYIIEHLENAISIINNDQGIVIN